MSDLQALDFLERACFPDPWSIPTLAEALRHESYLVLVERNNEGTPLGYLIGWQVGDEAELARIGIVPEARQLGHARTLLDKALQRWRERDVSRVFLEVRENNLAARRLYETRGFLLVGKRKRYYADGTDALVLSLDMALI